MQGTRVVDPRNTFAFREPVGRVLLPLDCAAISLKVDNDGGTKSKDCSDAEVVVQLRKNGAWSSEGDDT